MNEASKRRRQSASQEASLMGRQWESERSRKRRLREAKRTHGTNGTRLLETAAAFAILDDRARDRTRGRIFRATGDGGKIEPKEAPCLTYNESARRIMSY